MKNSNIKIGSNKNFGIVFSFFFFLVAIYIFYKSENINFILIFLSILFLTLGIINSKILTPLNFLWFKFGIILSKIVSPIIMILIFFIVVTPTGLLMKLLKKDILKLKKDSSKTYWIKKPKIKSEMKNQF